MPGQNWHLQSGMDSVKQGFVSSGRVRVLNQESGTPSPHFTSYHFFYVRVWLWHGRVWSNYGRVWPSKGRV